MKYLVYLFFLLFYCCRQNNKFQYVKINDTKVKSIVKEYQKQNIPNNDKIILIELNKNVLGNNVLFLSTINHPNDLNEYEKYFIFNCDEIVIFFSAPGSSYFNYNLDNMEVAKFIKEKYGDIDNNAEYEVDMSSEALSGGWYITLEDSLNYKVFNMTDSIQLHGNVNCQYKKLEKFIDPTCDCCDCD